MTQEELEVYIDNARVINLVSIGKDGMPHPMPMFFGRAKDGTIEMTTYGTSQKIKNIERDPRVALLIESGDAYEELKGAVLYCKTELVRDPDRVLEFMLGRNRESAELDEETMKALTKQSQKRLLMRFHVERVVTWDHSKLGGIL